MGQSNQLYIDGKWVNSSSGATFQSLNPATEKSLGDFALGNKHDVNHAIESAESSREAWSDVPAPKRGLILLKAAELLKKDKERLGKLVTEEMGKILPEGLGDVQEAIDIFEYMAGEGRRLLGHTTPSELPNKFCATTRRPIGTVGLITPWNFPIAIPAWKSSAALITGNSIVMKVSSDTPSCAIEFVKILVKAGVPKGVINLITGSGKDTGMPLVKDKRVRGISFTGHRDTGKLILKNAGLKKVGLELGSKNGIIVMDDAKLELAIEGILFGGFGTTGQRCTAASRVIVHEKILSKLEKSLVSHAKRLKVGNGLKSDVGPLINKAAVEKSSSYVEIGKKEGGKLLCGGSSPSKKGFFFKPTVFTDITKDMTIAQEEIFGPVVSLMPVSDIEEAIDVINKIDYGLSSSIYTQDVNNAFRAIEKIESGITYVNSSTIGSEVHLPFGGVKDTGNGAREAGIEGINEFSETKTVYVDYSGKLQKAQINE